MFESITTMDEASLTRVRDCLVPTPTKIGLIAFAAVFAGIAVAGAVQGRIALLLLALGGIVLMVVEYLFYRRRAVKLNVARIQKTFGTAGIAYLTRLDKDGVYLENQINHAAETMPYPLFCKLLEYPELYVLLTKRQQFVLINKAGWSEGQKAAFLDFLRHKPTNIRWKTPPAQPQQKKPSDDGNR